MDMRNVAIVGGGFVLGVIGSSIAYSFGHFVGEVVLGLEGSGIMFGSILGLVVAFVILYYTVKAVSPGVTPIETFKRGIFAIKD